MKLHGDAPHAYGLRVGVRGVPSSLASIFHIGNISLSLSRLYQNFHNRDMGGGHLYIKVWGWGYLSSKRIWRGKCFSFSVKSYV